MVARPLIARPLIARPLIARLLTARPMSLMLLIACAACAAPVPQAQAPGTTVSGNAINTTGTAPDSVAGAKPARYKDNAIDTDPSSPRNADKGQRVQTPVRTQ